MVWRVSAEARLRDERGFTLQETLVTVFIMGLLLAIGIIIFLGILERWRVDAAATQVKADLRMAHSSASNQLTDWRVVFVPGRGDESVGPDYYLIKMAGVDGTTRDAGTPVKERYLPANVEVSNHSSNLNDSTTNPDNLISGSPASTRTLEVNPNGTLAFRVGPSGTVCVTIDEDPQRRITALAATSRVRVKLDYNEAPCD